jgi:hypothetical protein
MGDQSQERNYEIKTEAGREIRVQESEPAIQIMEIKILSDC